MRKIALFAFLAVNMALVIAGALRLPIASIPLVGRVAADYGVATGCANSFGFFCSVPSQLRPRFFITRPYGREEEVSLFEGRRMSREAELRHLGAIGIFKDVPDDAGREQLIRSWAAKLFTRFPDASAITVQLELYEIPTPNELGRGERPAWKPAGVVRVTRSDHNLEAK